MDIGPIVPIVVCVLRAVGRIDCVFVAGFFVAHGDHGAAKVIDVDAPWKGAVAILRVAGQQTRGSVGLAQPDTLGIAEGAEPSVWTD